MAVATIISAQRPLHFQASTLVLEATKSILENYGVETAMTKLEEVCSIAERMIPQLDQENAIPLSVTLHLIDLLESPKIQCEYRLQYTIAKACRIFMDITFVQAVKTQTSIRPDTHKEILEKLKKVIYSVPAKNAMTKYELSCCWATALVLNSAVEYLKEFVSAHIGSVVEAVATQSPGKLVAPLKQALIDLWNLIETYWFNDVLTIHLRGKIEISQFDFTKAADFKSIYRALPMVREYKKASETAHCFFGLLKFGMTQSVQANNAALQVNLLKGEDSDTAPGLIDMAEYGKDELLDRFNSSWGVRHEAIDFLFHTSQNEKLREDVWKIILTLIANKFSDAENKYVSSLISNHLRQLRTNFNQQSLRPRVVFFLSQIRGTVKLEQGVQHELASLRRKKEHLHTDLKGQLTALNDKKEALHELPVILPAQQDSKSEEEKQKAEQQKETLKREVKGLESQVEKTTDTVEQVEMQEEFLSLLELEGK